MSAMYPAAKTAILTGGIDLTNDTIRAVLVDTGTYTYDSAHDVYSDLLGVVGSESDALGSKTVTGGVFDAADVTFAAVSGATVEALVIFQDTGSAATDRLIMYLDAGVGFPLTPSGGPVTVKWPADGIFDLADAGQVPVVYSLDFSQAANSFYLGVI